jgi:hypothetical protein
MQIKKNKLQDASYDLRFLLNRGYRKKNALSFVSNKYLLSKHERNYLARSIYSDFIVKSRIDKLVDISAIENQFLLVDGYNVLISVESICKKDYGSLILCDDGIIRDLNAVFGKYKLSEYTKKALDHILVIISAYNPKIRFLFDRQVSFSGKLAKMTEELMNIYKIEGDAVLSSNADFEIIKIGNIKDCVVATSDSAIIDKVNRILDLPFYILQNKGIKEKL